jgi:phosphoribosylpyrophosphate synthetase
VDNLEAQYLMADYVLNSNIIENYNNLVIVSPDAGGVYR